jgi:hypothetical protein
MMLRLSLSSSQHLQYVRSASPPFICISNRIISQPYKHLGEAFDDLPRKTLRDTRKKLGYPASGDVGTLSNMIRALRDEASSFVGEPVSTAAISIPHLVALYGEDLHDAFEYLSLIYLDFFPFWNFRPIHASNAAYAGNGQGFCRDYRDVMACKEEETQFPTLFALSVSYTYTSLITSQARLADAYYIQETPKLENLRLGYDARHDDDDEESYWEAVREMLRSPVRDSPVQRNISVVLVFGDSTKEPRFRNVLEEVINDLGGEQEIIDQDPEFSAAKGTAEMAKRVIFSQGPVTESDL